MAKKGLVLSNNPLFAGPALRERDRGAGNGGVIGGTIGTPYRELDLALIDRDPAQPRVEFDQVKLNELASSIKTYGVMTPILVRASKEAGRYVVIAGERRFRAAGLVGLKAIPAVISSDDAMGDDKKLAMQLVENLQRADLSPLERAQAIGTLRDRYQLSVRDIADRLGISKSMAQRSLELLNLPDDLMNALKNGASESKVLVLAKIDDPDVRASYLKDLETLTRGALEKDVAQKVKAPKEGGMTPEDERVSDEIRKALGLKVGIARSSRDSEHGKIVVEFYSDRDLQEIFRRLVA